ncbi:hypothetical protein ARMGADRAFT_1040885 [Armillaria gallica]|uniref:Uncharacterized protein n=1 Tax=Armillaria gallica TaxID=47427 RepID=A0A2H3C8C5_ARMGA|nr:hypothetical protein ARMGADRAFT_1040883 [Armillaria gallica]PBK79329.1 hypothetical protein ARMGADRAFT_1040885 [Armillaria gallica]
MTWMLPGLEHLQLAWSGEGAVLDMLKEQALKSVVIGIREGGCMYIVLFNVLVSIGEDRIIKKLADPETLQDLEHLQLVLGGVKAHNSSDLKVQLKLDDLLADAEYLKMFILGQLKIDFHASVAFLSAEP